MHDKLKEFGMVANDIWIYKGPNPKKHGTSLCWWTCLSVGAISLRYNIFPDFKYIPPTFVYVALEANTKAKGVASLSTLEFEGQGEQLVVTTKLTNPIRRGTNLKFIPLPIVTLFLLNFQWQKKTIILYLLYF